MSSSTGTILVLCQSLANFTRIEIHMVITTVPKYGKVNLPYPARVSKNEYGKCLVASDDLGRGEIVGRFDGPILTSYAMVPTEEVCHVLAIGIDNYMIVRSPARFINHSCDPNCTIDDDYYVVTINPVNRGEEFTIRYNDLEPKYDGMDFFWDPRWTFTCRCGAPNCVGKIDRYMVYKRPENET